MPRRRLVVVLVVSLACVAAAALAVLPRVLSGPREVSVTDILACVPPDIDYAKVEDPAVASCLEDALYASIEFQGVRGTDVLVAEAEKATPRMSLMCHSVLHSVGKRALPLVGDLGTAIPELPMNSCSNGLLHGFADQMALESPSDEVLRRQAEICQRDMGTRADICADALGHMFWTTRPELPAAAERCAWFTDPNAIRYCTAGVIMRMVSPQPGSSTPMHTPQQIVDACRSWPVPGPDAGHGCALGVAYAVYETTAGSFKDELTQIQSNGVDDATLATWIDALLPGQKLCEELPLRNQVTRCVTVLGVNMVNKASDPQILMAWCDRVPDYSRDFCRAGQPDAPLDAQGRPVRQEPGGSPGG